MEPLYSFMRTLPVTVFWVTSKKADSASRSGGEPEAAVDEFRQLLGDALLEGIGEVGRQFNCHRNACGIELFPFVLL